MNYDATLEPAPGWEIIYAVGFQCEHDACVGSGTEARWRNRDIQGILSFACNVHVPREAATVTLPRAGVTTGLPSVVYPVWLTSKSEIISAGLSIRMDSDGHQYVRVINHQRDDFHPLYLAWIRPVLHLLEAVGYGIEVSDSNTATIKARRPVMNPSEVAQRHEARRALLRARRQMVYIQDDLVMATSRWEALKRVRAQYLDIGMVKALALGISEWPEVMDAVTYPDYIDLEGFGHIAPPEGSIALRFWPVFYDNVRDITGLTTPMVFEVDPEGHIAWKGTGAHPHAYNRDGELCAGTAEFGAGMSRSLGQLRDWWVGTDGGPANTEWASQSKAWWERWQGTFFERTAAMYIVAPMDETDEARVRGLTDVVLEELLDRTDAYEACECGTRLSEGNGFYCEEGDHTVCVRCWSNGTGGNCEEHIEEHICDGCGDTVSRGWHDERHTCSECGKDLCRYCFGREQADNGDENCQNCAPEPEGDDEDDSDIDTVVYAADHGVPIGPELIAGATTANYVPDRNPGCS